MKKFIFVASICLLLGGCGSSSSNPKSLPKNAYAITDIGNDWVTFKLDFNTRTDTFLFHKANANANNAIETITKIKEEYNK